jgi:hypothetical protein
MGGRGAEICTMYSTPHSSNPRAEFFREDGDSFVQILIKYRPPTDFSGTPGLQYTERIHPKGDLLRHSIHLKVVEGISISA